MKVVFTTKDTKSTKKENSDSEIGRTLRQAQGDRGAKGAKKIQKKKRRFHRGGTEVAEFGVFFNQNLFTTRPPRLGGKFSFLK
jgi:hypothetical protein